MAEMPDTAKANLQVLCNSIDSLENTIGELLKVSDPSDRTTIENVRIELAALIANNTLYWAHERLQGRAPNENEELKAELKRTKKYMQRMKEIDDMENRPKVNQKIASALLRNAMFDVDEQNEKKAESAKEKPSSGKQTEDEPNEEIVVRSAAKTKIWLHKSKSGIAAERPARAIFSSSDARKDRRRSPPCDDKRSCGGNVPVRPYRFISVSEDILNSQCTHAPEDSTAAESCNVCVYLNPNVSWNWCICRRSFSPTK